MFTVVSARAGWFSGVSGICLLIIIRRNILTKNWLAFTVFVASVFMVLLLRFQDVDYFLGLWLGMRGDYDLETQIAFPFFLGLMRLYASLLLLIVRD
jgi:hypothetical protein